MMHYIRGARESAPVSEARTSGPALAQGSPFILLADHHDRMRRHWWNAFMAGAFAAMIFGALAVLAFPAHSQTVPPPAPLPTSYTFTFTPESTDKLYQALERASQLQAMVTGERSPGYDALEEQLRQAVTAQKATAAAKASEKPKDDPKTEAKP